MVLSLDTYIKEIMINLRGWLILRIAKSYV
jgi:hypothetical protein